MEPLPDLIQDQVDYIQLTLFDGDWVLVRTRVEERMRECRLTPKETELCWLLFSGASTAELASKLYVSGETVKNHLTSIFIKTRTRNRANLVLRLLGFIDPDPTKGIGYHHD